jgi:uncharacterized membrane protein (UPF0127 family)
MSTILVRIINKTRNTTLAEKAQIANTFFSRGKGLLGRSGLTEGQGLVITNCSSVHTFFMRFKIDIVFLGRNNRVVGLAKSLAPARLAGYPLKARLAVELPAGILAKTNTQKGDEIVVEPLK